MDKLKRLYNNKRWWKLRHWQLRHSPFCVRCEEAGMIRPAQVVDHIKPHRGSPVLFWDKSNLQSLCKKCHDGSKNSEDRLASKWIVDEDGWLIKPRK